VAGSEAERLLAALQAGGVPATRIGEVVAAGKPGIEIA
jgi:hypothetical protein